MSVISFLRVAFARAKFEITTSPLPRLCCTTGRAYVRPPPYLFPTLAFRFLLRAPRECATCWTIATRPSSDGDFSDSDTQSQGEFGTDPKEDFGGFAGFQQEAQDALKQTGSG